LIPSGVKTKEYCDKRLCDACFKNNAPLKLTCGTNGCEAQISYDLRRRSHIYNDYLNYLVFICPLDEPCNQQLTYTDFIKHTHLSKKTEKRKEKKQIETTSQQPFGNTNTLIYPGKEMDNYFLYGFKNMEIRTRGPYLFLFQIIDK